MCIFEGGGDVWSRELYEKRPLAAGVFLSLGDVTALNRETFINISITPQRDSIDLLCLGLVVRPLRLAKTLFSVCFSALKFKPTTAKGASRRFVPPGQRIFSGAQTAGKGNICPGQMQVDINYARIRAKTLHLRG